MVGPSCAASVFVDARGEVLEALGALFEPLFRIQPQFARKAAVVCGDRILAEPFAQMARRALGYASR